MVMECEREMGECGGSSVRKGLAAGVAVMRTGVLFVSLCFWRLRHRMHLFHTSRVTSRAHTHTHAFAISISTPVCFAPHTLCTLPLPFVHFAALSNPTTSST